MAIVMAIGAPSYKTWIHNTKIRNATESVVNGLQLARAQAVSRNTPVQFDLRTGSGGASWTVCQQPAGGGRCPDPDNATTVQSYFSNEGAASAIVVAPKLADGTDGGTTIVFNNFGRVVPVLAPLPLAFAQLNVDISTAVLTAAESRDLRITIGVGGNARMCDPDPGLSGTDPRKC